MLAVALTLLGPLALHAEVTRVEIASRADLAFAGYEKIVGRVFFAVDPTDPRNAIVADLDKAPRNADGRVEFSADFELVRPKSGGNGVALIDIVNRGGRTVIPNFNRAGGRDPDVGDGFLLRRGFTVAAVGWEFDVPASRGLIRVDVPAAREAGQAITGIVRAAFTPAQPQPFLVGDLAAYLPVDPEGPDSVLTVRDNIDGPSETVPRESWTLVGTMVTLQGGFTPGRIYELSFRAANPPVGGLGFVAVRDFATWIKHEPGAITTARYAYAFGNSQSGRFLRTFLYQGFNSDERGRQVLDATLINIAGAARLDLNRRWATPTTAAAPATQFPFADRALLDPISGMTDGLLENARAVQSQPKIIYTNTGVEYWSASGRAAALTHTTPDGSSDLELPDNVRSYFLAGAQHSPGAFPPVQALGQQPGNPLDYWWTLRALLVAMDGWVREGTAPPLSDTRGSTAERSWARSTWPSRVSQACSRHVRFVRRPERSTSLWRAGLEPGRPYRTWYPRLTPTATSSRGYVSRTCPCRSRPTRDGTSADPRLAARIWLSRCWVRTSPSRVPWSNGNCAAIRDCR